MMSTSEKTLRVEYRGERIEIAAKLRRTSEKYLVFLHGLGCTKESFDNAFQADELQDYSICTFDFPGHGESGKLPQPNYSLHMYAEITDLVIQHLLYRQLFIVGHSMGGAVGIIATQGRSDISCFVSADGNLVALDCGLISRDIANQSSAAFTGRGYSQFIDTLRRSSRIDLSTWGQWCGKADPSALHQVARSLVEWSDSEKLLDLFNALPCKSYLYGDQDDKEYLLNRMQDATISAVTNAGHFMMLDNPNCFYRVLSKALTVQDEGIARRRAAAL